MSSTFTVVRRTSLSPAEAWARVVDWSAHGRYVPFTAIRVRTPPPAGVGTVFVARTALGRVGFDDPMEVVRWRPPGPDGHGRLRLEKRGRVVLGFAEIEVGPGPAGGTVVTWREEARVTGLPRALGPVNALAGRLLFGRVLRRLLSA